MATSCTRAKSKSHALCSQIRTASASQAGAKFFLSAAKKRTGPLFRDVPPTTYYNRQYGGETRRRANKARNRPFSLIFGKSKAPFSPFQQTRLCASLLSKGDLHNKSSELRVFIRPADLHCPVSRIGGKQVIRPSTNLLISLFYIEIIIR